MIRSNSRWPTNSKELAIQLHSELTINNTDWHVLKGDSDRRAAELLSGAIVQLLSGGNSSDIQELVEQSMLWIKREIKAPTCPDH